MKLLSPNCEIVNKSFQDLLQQLEENADQFQLQLDDDLYSIKFNSPWINNLTLPSSILAGFYVYPSRLEMDFADRHHSRFIWYRGNMTNSQRDDDVAWEEIGRGFSFLIRPEDIGFKIKVVVTPKAGNCDKEGPSVQVISNNDVQVKNI